MVKSKLKLRKYAGLEMSEYFELRSAIFWRDDFTCLRCDKRFANRKSLLSIHHLVPRSKGGSNDPTNLVTLCNPCHDYVEIYELKSIADIMGSDDTVVYHDQSIEFFGTSDKYRPEWHSWVYGGSPNPETLEMNNESKIESEICILCGGKKK